MYDDFNYSLLYLILCVSLTIFLALYWYLVVVPALWLVFI
jgi:hypothetical protein